MKQRRVLGRRGASSAATAHPLLGARGAAPVAPARAPVPHTPTPPSDHGRRRRHASGCGIRAGKPPVKRARAVGSPGRGSAAGKEASRSCVRAGGRTARSPGCAPGAAPPPPSGAPLPQRPRFAPPAPGEWRGGVPCPHRPPRSRGGKQSCAPTLTCAELQAGAVATRVAAARGGCRAGAVPDDGGEGRRRGGGGGRGRRRRSPQVALGRGGRAGRRRRRGGGGGPAGPGGVGALGRERRRRRLGRLAAADGARGEGREGRRGRPHVRQLHQGGSLVALGQSRSLARERLEDAVGAALLVDFGDAGPLLRCLHLLLHAAPRGRSRFARPLPARRPAPWVPPPAARRLCPCARVWAGVWLCRGRRHRRLSPRLASPSPRAGGCRPSAD